LYLSVWYLIAELPKSSNKATYAVSLQVIKKAEMKLAAYHLDFNTKVVYISSHYYLSIGVARNANMPHDTPDLFMVGVQLMN
jgi:hypothetical protein